MTYRDHGHPIVTNPYKSSKNSDIDLRLLGYDHMDNLRSLRRPTLTNHDHAHPIETNPYKLAKELDVHMKLS